MKTNLFALVAVLTVPLFAGCAPSTSAEEPSAAIGGSAPVTNAPEAQVVAAAVETAVPPAVATNLPVGRVLNPEPVAPANLRLNAPAMEIVKLAQAGLAPEVMLAYVTNSLHTFNLGADELVYLNDLGIAPEVMTAMIQHDQRIREASLQGAVAAAPATPAPPTSVWSPAASAPASNVWQQPAAAPAPTANEAAAPAPLPEESRPAQVTVNYFYDSLSPYGTWIDIEGYGRCWRPTVAVTTIGWRPYQHGGRWIWTDYGWYWYSDYSWGWAPFHYGRWFTHPHWGWVWWPDTVWGPSWVTWRYTDAYCGWAPLPPGAHYRPGVGFSYYGSSVGYSFGFGLGYSHYTFVSYHHFRGRHYDRYCVPRHEAPRIYNHSTVVNNIITGDNNVIINNGIGRDRVEAVTRSEVPRVRVQETAAAPARTPGRGRYEQLSPDGRTLNVTRNVIAGTPVAGGSRGELPEGRNEISVGGAIASPAGTPAAAPDVTPKLPGVRGDRPPHQANLIRGGRDTSPAATPRAETVNNSPAPVAAPVRAETGRNETVRPIRPSPERDVPAPVASAPPAAPPTPDAAPSSPAVRSEESRAGRVVIIGSRNDRPGAPASGGAATPRSWNIPLNGGSSAAAEAVAPPPVAAPNVRSAPVTPSPSPTPNASANVNAGGPPRFSVWENGRVEPARQPPVVEHPRANIVRAFNPAPNQTPVVSSPVAPASPVIRTPPMTPAPATPRPQPMAPPVRTEPVAPRISAPSAPSPERPSYTPPARTYEAPRVSPPANAPIRQFSAPESRPANPAQGPGRLLNNGPNGPRGQNEKR